MKKTILMVFLSMLYFGVSAQNIVKGIVVDSDSEKPIKHVQVGLKSTQNLVKTSISGEFILKNIANGTYILQLKLEGYESQNFPIQLTGTPIDLEAILFYKEASEDLDVSIITINDDELNGETTIADNISGLLQSSKDLYLRTAAYEFSSSFFRVKGLDSQNAFLLINGIEMNKIYHGRPQWSNWGGLNDVLRNQEFSAGLTPSSYTFGGLLGSTNINTRASKARPGSKISYASSNRSYTHRVMASYTSGLLKNDWAFTFAASRRAGNEGYSDGTFYKANSFFTSIEKKINDKHSLSFSAFYTPNERGKSSANTQEVYDLKGIRYNSYWGLQDGKKRNSRIKEVIEPVLMLNHYWTFSEKSTLQTNIGYQFGKVGNTRIDYNGSKIDGMINNIPSIVSLGGSNPDPTYYQKLPSYGLRENYSNVYTIRKEFIEGGQLNWSSLYQGNQNSFNSGNSTYVLYEDRNDDQQLTLNTILESELTDHILLNTKVGYKNLTSKNFAKVLDLLAGKGYLDIDGFATDNERKQNNLQQPNSIVAINDTFKYNYNLHATVIDGFLQAQFKYSKIDSYVAASFSKTSYQREGFYQNGKFKNESLGKSEKLLFTNVGVKGGFTYKITGRHLIHLNTGYITKAPTLRNSFSNPRTNNAIVENITNEKITTADISYIFRSPFVQAKLTGYYTKIKDATEVSFYYADGIGGSGSDFTAFVQEILTGIDKRHLGIEVGVEAQIIPTVKLKGAANIGQYTYNNNPNLSLTSEAANFQFKTRSSNLKNYKIPAGPQQAYSIGFEYRAPEYWWLGATMNFFGNTYVDINPLTRTNNFSDDGGVPFNDYNPVLAKELLKQEKFDPYKTINVVGGKTWKINNYYVGFFASINNLLNTKYKTGGFEQGRNANYRELRDDKSLEKPVFGNKYWYGRGTTYFLNLNIRF